MVVSPVRAPRSPAVAALTETNVTTAILASTSPSDVRTAVDTLADAREEARLAREQSTALRAKAADALKAAEETDAIASQAEAEVSAALDILERAQKRATQRARHVNSPIAAVATTPLPSDVGKDVVVYTDGSVIPGAHSAIGIFFGAGHPLNAGVELRANRHDEGLCQLAAIQCALRLLLNNPETRGRPIVIRTDYKNVLNSNRHQSDRVFRAEYERLRNLIDQFPRGVRYEHVEGQRGTFGNNEAHRLARDALRNSVKAANPRTRTNSNASARAKSADSKGSQKSTKAQRAPRSVDQSGSRSSHTASMSKKSANSRTSRTKSTAASTARSIVPTAAAPRSGPTTANSSRSKRSISRRSTAKSTAASTARSIVPTSAAKSPATSTARSILPASTARSGATTANSSRSISKRTVARPAAPKGSSSKSARQQAPARLATGSPRVSIGSSASRSSKRPATKKPQTSVRVAAKSPSKKSGASGITSMAASTANSIKSVKSKREGVAVPSVDKSAKSSRVASKSGASMKSVRSARSKRVTTAAVKQQQPGDVTTARARTPVRSPTKSSAASKKSVKSTRSWAKRPRTPAPEAKNGSVTKSTRQASPNSRQSDNSAARSVRGQSSVSRTQNSNSASRSFHSGASRGASAADRR